MEQTVATLKPTPAKTKKKWDEIIPDKIYEFELCTRYEATRVKDKKTDTPLGSGWPPHFSYPNHGAAKNPTTGKVENWRYIEGQNSIWVSEQTDLVDYEKKDIDRLLGEDVNQLDFKDGRLLVVGNAAGKLRLNALFISDYYEGKEEKYKAKAPMDMFRLNNPDAVTAATINVYEKEFKLMEQAMNSTVDTMLAVSSLLGINVQDQSDYGLNRIKQQFLNKARFDKENPKALDFFSEVINNPATNIRYIFSQGLAKGIISSTQQPGKLTWAAPNTAILELMTNNAAEELTAKVIDKEKEVIAIMEEVDRLLKDKGGK